MSKPKLYIVDDHPIVLQGLISFLESAGHYNIVGSSTNGQKALEDILWLKPDIAILDIYVPELSGLEIIKSLQAKKSPTKLVMLTTYKEKLLLQQAKEQGVKGYLLKDFALEEITDCLAKVAAGNVYFSKHLDDLLVGPGKFDFSILTKTELTVVKLIAQDKSTSEIAQILFVSPKTIENQRSNISKKLKLDKESHSLYKWVIKHREQLLR